MRVSRLEAFGFKSFLERLVLPLDSGITAIVGPNGCGKSNIVDAVRWILGETKASSLRGGVLEDVIFNGTDKLRPLGLAEVTLTLRAAEQGFFPEMLQAFRHPASRAECTASAVAGDSICNFGKPEVKENEATPAAALDSAPAELSLTGVKGGRPQLTVIDGALGQAGAAGSTLCVENDAMEAEVEELLSEKAEAQPEGELAQAMLTRFAWLRSVPEVQVTRRLYRSGESEFFINRVPCRLKDIRDLFRALGLSARAYTVVAQGEVSRIVSARAEERRLIIEEAAGVAGFRERIATTSRRLEETTVNLSRLDDVINEVTRQVNSLKIQAARARNREQLRERIGFLEKILFQEDLVSWSLARQAREAALETAKMEEADCESAYQKALAEEQEARGALMAVDVESDALRGRIDSLKEELESRSRRRGEFSMKIGELQAYIRAREEELGALRERRRMLAERLEESVLEISGLKAQENELIGLLGEFEGHHGDKVQVLQRQVTQSSELLKEGERELNTIRERIISTEVRLTALREQLAAVSPLTQLRQALGQESGAAAELEKLIGDFAGRCQLFADGLKIPPHLSRAVQAVLAERAAFLLCPEPEALIRRYADRASLVLQAGQEPCSLGVFKADSAAELRADRPQDKNQPPLPALLDLIEVTQPARLAANEVFAGVYLCNTLEEALRFFETCSGEAGKSILVTLDGEIVTHYSFSNMCRRPGLVEQKKEAEQLGETLDQLRLQQERKSAEVETLRCQLAQVQREYEELVLESQRQQEEVRELANRQGSIRGKLQVASRLHSQLGQDLHAVERAISEMLVQIDLRRKEQSDLAAQIEALAGEQEKALGDELAELRRAYVKLDETRQNGRERLSKLTLSLDKSRAAREKAREVCNQCAFELQKLDMEVQNLRQRIRTDYGEEVLASLEAAGLAVAKDQKAQRLSAAQKSDYEEEVKRLRSRILREGEVDGTSIQRYEEEKTRLEHLTSQKQDLEQAAATLRKTVDQLTLASEQRFLATFAAVRDNFARLVPRLFGGGKGSLELIDPSRPLESGVDIVIRPPGKRLKTIELLSGGEKALCAIALIFGMFACRPSPLCVLDEVDAPLDDANLVRFLALIKEMSAKTQFILITHNKQSMAMADNLVGVTMPQPGASKIVTVSLQEAYAHVA